MNVIYHEILVYWSHILLHPTPAFYRVFRGEWLTFIHHSGGETYRIITSKLANQGARKALLTGLVYTYTYFNICCKLPRISPPPPVLGTSSSKQKMHPVITPPDINPILACIYMNRPFYRYGSHIVLVRFMEYYGMPTEHEHIPVYLGSPVPYIYLDLTRAFRGTFS